MTPTLDSFVATHVPRLGRVIAALRGAAAELDDGAGVTHVGRRLRKTLVREMQGGDRIPLLLSALRKWDKMNEPAIFAESLRLEAQRLETWAMSQIADLIERKKNGTPCHDD